MPFDPERLQKLRNRISSRKTKLEADHATNKQHTGHLETVRKMLAGDHWLEGAGWTGPQPTESDKAAEVLRLIERVFVSRNLIGEVCIRHRDAVAGDEGAWDFTVRRELGVTFGEDNTPTPEKTTEAEDALITEANAAMTAWWDSSGVWAEIQDAVLNLVAQGRGVIRLYIPREETVEQSDGSFIVPKADLETVIKSIYVVSADPESAGEVRSDERVRQGAFFTFKDDLSSADRREYQYVDKKEGVTYIGLETGSEFDSIGYKIGGNLLIFEMVAPMLVSPQVVSQQKNINKYYTMMSRNNDVAGFVERTILNAQMPGAYTKNDKGEEIFVPGRYTAGAGITNFVAPYSYENPDGTKSYIPSSIDFRDPVPVTTFTESIASTKHALYDEVKQSHILISGDATASGRSREQATNDFRTSLRPTVTQLEACLRWMLETTLRLASVLAGTPGKFDALRPNVQARIIVTQPSAADIDVDIKLVDKGLMSRENAMTRSGRVQDTAAERVRLRLEAREDRGIGDPNVLRDSVAGAVTAGLFSQSGGLRELGFSEQEASKIVDEHHAETSALDTGSSLPRQPTQNTGG
jgi:hypothetical protein